MYVILVITCSLEAVLHGELHDARVARLRGDAAERAGIEAGGGVTPVEMVQQVEGLHANLDRPAHAHRQKPGDGQIHVPVRGSLDAAGDLVPKRTWRGE